MSNVYQLPTIKEAFKTERERVSNELEIAVRRVAECEATLKYMKEQVALAGVLLTEYDRCICECEGS